MEEELLTYFYNTIYKKKWKINKDIIERCIFQVSTSTNISKSKIYNIICNRISNQTIKANIWQILKIDTFNTVEISEKAIDIIYIFIKAFFSFIFLLPRDINKIILNVPYNHNILKKIIKVSVDGFQKGNHEEPYDITDESNLIFSVQNTEFLFWKKGILEKPIFFISIAAIVNALISEVLEKSQAYMEFRVKTKKQRTKREKINYDKENQIYDSSWINYEEDELFGYEKEYNKLSSKRIISEDVRQVILNDTPLKEFITKLPKFKI